jgi:RNA polymerase sigma-32 factor
MAKTTKKSETPELMVDKKIKTKTSKSDVIVETPGSTNYLPVVKKTTALKVQDPLSLYLKEIARHKLLSPAEEKELTMELLKTGDIDVAKKLVLANLRLVVKIALEYKSAYKNVMDLIQEGNIGLMKAVSKYDPAKGAKLSYYASWWIRSYILKFILDNFRLVKIGTTQEQKKLFYNLMREKQRLLNLGLPTDVKMLSESLGVSEKAVLEMDHRLGSYGQEVSMDRPLDDNGGSQTLGDMLSDQNEGPESQLEGLLNLEILREHLGEFIKTLKPRDQEIFEKRLLSEIPESLQSIADQYGVSRERIRQVEERLISQLKIYMSEFLR